VRQLIVMRALVLIALAAGCSHEGLQGDDTATDAGVLAGSDGGQSVDLGLCTTHVFEAVPASSFKMLFGVYQQYQSVQIVVNTPLSPGCDLQGPIDIRYDIGDDTDFVHFVSHRLHQVGGDCPAPVPAPYVITIAGNRLAHLALSIADGAPNPTAPAILLSVKPGIPDCTPLLNNACDTDCQCIGLTGGASHCLNGFCHVPCNSDSDCAVDADNPACNTLEGAPFACGPAFQCPMTCPFGQECDPMVKACRPRNQVVICSSSCSCDANCSAGFICRDGKCTAPCAVTTDCLASVCQNGACTEFCE
jgi:hypothetical protein